MNKRSLLLLSFLTAFISQTFSQSYQPTAGGIKTKTGGLNIELRFYTPKIVRIIKSPDAITSSTSLSVIASPQKVITRISTNDRYTQISSNAISVKIYKQNGQVVFTDLKGNSLLSEKAKGANFTPFKDAANNTYAISQSFELKPNEAVYGLGQHQAGTMNQRKQKITLRQENMEVAVPFMHSAKGYGLFWDNYSTTVFDDNAAGTSFTSEVGNNVDYYFMEGGNADGVIAGYRYLTGQVPMFPRWALGYWQSRERYKTQQEVVGVLKKYRELQIPIDGIVQDWQYWGEDELLWNSTEFGNPGFPDPGKLVDSVHSLNAHIIISVWPCFGNKTKIWADMKQHGFLYNNFKTWPVNNGVQVYDAFNPKARDLYWSYMKKNIFSLGFDGWWLDSTEPDHPSAKQSDENVPTYLGTYLKMRNAFPLMTTGGVYQHQRKTSDNKRVFILARSAFAGQQRNGSMVWSGDINSDWGVFRKQISGGLNLSLSGIPYWNTDIGGFFAPSFTDIGAKGVAFQELYTRWLQFGTFLPMMRSHGTNVPREIYQFGQKGDWAYDAVAKYINLRYRLLPYNYSNAWDITANSGTMLRALVMDFPADEHALDINNEYMFGKAFLVCPVTDSMYTSKAKNTADFSKVKTQPVYLPAGHTWFDFWTGDHVKGAQTINKETPVDIMPLYVKAGSIIPMGPFQQYASQKDMKELEIRVYPGADGTFTLYEDENDNYNYEKGIHTTIDIRWSDKTKTLSIANRKGSYPGMIKNRIFNVVLVSKGHGIGSAVIEPDKQLNYNGKALAVKL
jgi:alpha-D-xyloside xylohydrolase